MKYRYYKLSIQLGLLRYVNNSKVYQIKEGKSTILPGLVYSLATILLGWWGFRFLRALRESTEALSINFSGGEDISKAISKTEYDDDTNYIWDNLLRETSDKLSKDDLEIILQLQYEFAEKRANEIYSEANVDYLLTTSEKLAVQGADNTVISDVFETLKMYESRST